MIKKRLFRFGSVFMCATLMACSLAACGGANTAKVNQDAVIESQAAGNNAQSTISDAISTQFKNVFNTTSSSSTENSKEETVYVFTDTTGKQDHVIVNSKLKNVKNASTLKDASTLSDITNLSGDENSTGSGNDLTWNANGNSITYQGTTSKQTPVSMKVTYKLDGKEISAQDLAGKSGKVTIHYDYTNNEKKTVTVNGTTKTVYVPFTMITGIMLPSDKFSNVTVTNGKVTDYNDGVVALGVTMPGLKDSLKQLSLGDEKLDLDVPESFEVTADVTDFELEMAMSVASSNLLTDMNLDSLNMDSTKDDINTLTDAGNQLQDGATKLADGTGALFSKMPELSNGILQLAQGSSALADGTIKLQNGVESFTDQLKGGTSQLAAKLPQLQSGVSEYTGGVETAKDGSKEMTDGFAKLAESFTGDDTAENPGLIKGMASLSQGADDLSAGLAKLATAVKGTRNQLATNAGSYDNNTEALASAQQIESIAVGKGLNTALQALGNNDLLITPHTDLASISPKTMTADELKTTYVALYKKYMNAYAFATANASDPHVQAMNAGLSAYGMTLADVYSNEMGLLVSTVSNESVAGSLYTVVNQLDTTKDADTKMNLSDSIDYMKNKVDNELVPGVRKIKAGIGTANELIATSPVKEPVTVCQALNKLALGSGQLTAGLNLLTSKNTELNGGVNAAVAGVNQLDAGVSTGKSQLMDNENGVPALVSGAGQVKDGLGQLNDNRETLVDGVTQLNDGMLTLKDGMIEFNETGVQKIASLLGTDAQTAMDTLKAIVNAGKDYQTFAGKSDDMNGSVQFIYKTDEITK